MPLRRSLVLACLAGGLLATGCTGSSGGTTAASASGRAVAASPSAAAAADGGTFGQIPAIVRDLEPAVVTIRSQIGLGSGVVYKANGVIVTDAHVVENQSKQPFKTVQVEFADGKQVPGTVVGVDDITDVAVVKVSRTGLPAAKFGSALPTVGELDVVIGSPLGLTESVTAGIVSGLHRDIPPNSEAPQGLIDLIQTDAPISPGNSGGAVADVNRTVIGLSEAYIPPSQGAVAIGFVTPAATVTDVADQLLATGHARHSYLGIVPADINPQVAQAYGLPSTGALVQQVEQGSPAAAAGLQPGDILVRFDGHDVGNVTDLLAALRGTKPGQQVQVTYVRSGSKHTTTVTLTDRPHSSG